jgi:hypothetical protein
MTMRRHAVCVSSTAARLICGYAFSSSMPRMSANRSIESNEYSLAFT